MKAMILAAGRGERLRPLTDTTPKPLLNVRGKPLIEWHIERLRDAGFEQLVVNVSWLKQQLIDFLGNGSRWGVQIAISEEPPGALETGGGIFNALPKLGNTFAVVNGDIWTDFPFDALKKRLLDNNLTHLILVPNPSQHPQGDFALANPQHAGPHQIIHTGGVTCTYSGIGVYRAELFADCTPGAFKLAPLINTAIAQARVSGECYSGEWSDIGTEERLQAINHAG
ncbi:MAG TPA: nucleotidyltransferase family protein [Gammaproteobacteria bacterium]|nr:nucleotidyltransferase family protein [Gammaproteobacteria bacterium]